MNEGDDGFRKRKESISNLGTQLKKLIHLINSFVLNTLSHPTNISACTEGPTFSANNECLDVRIGGLTKGLMKAFDHFWDQRVESIGTIQGQNT